MPKTWFVTGAARGIGAEIVKAALGAGDRVVATGRTPRNLEQAFRSGNQIGFSCCRSMSPRKIR